MKNPVYFREGMPAYSRDYKDGQEPGIVIDTNASDNPVYPIVVEFGGGTTERFVLRYTFDGCQNVMSESPPSLSQKPIALIVNEPLPEVGDIGYFYDDDNRKNVRYGRLEVIKDGHFFGWNSSNPWQNFSLTPPQID